MSVIYTNSWLKHLYNEKGLHRKKKKLPPFQQLMKHEPKRKIDDWLTLLYSNGMLPATNDENKIWEDWGSKETFHILTSLFIKLKEEFSGPNIDVFPFPIDVNNDHLMNVMNKKNGVTFPTMIFLFFDEGLIKEEKEALLIHEYHHACRLFYQKNNEHNVRLLESLVMEGLAEFEVKERLGEHFVSPWMTLYDDRLLLSWWERAVKDKRNIRNRKRHTPYIFGGIYGIPKWLGYGIGFRMVETYMDSLVKEGKKKPSSIERLKLSSDEIYKGSIFYK